MRILIINKFLYPNGGSETYIFKIGKQFIKMGHEVQYFGMNHAKRIVGNRIDSYTSDMDFHSGKLQRLLYPFKIIYSVEARKKLRAVLCDFQPEAVHLNNFNFQLTPSILYEIRRYQNRTGRKIAVIYTAHDSQLVCPNHLMQRYTTSKLCTECIGGSPWNCTRHRCIHGSFIKSFLGSAEAWVYRHVKAYSIIDTVICPSFFLKDKLDACPQLQDKTLVMHNFMEKPLKIREKSKPYVLYFGRYSKEKGIETLLEVCRRLQNIPFVFAGNGPMEHEVRTLSNVTDMGFLSGEKLQEIIAGASFSVFPSECNENCPFSVMESLAYGTPVVGAAIGGVPELIKNRENGVLFESGNAEQMEEMIRSLWDDEKTLKKMTENCKKTKFDQVEEYCEKVLKCYQSTYLKE